jgi:Cu+-exporting ATPase
MTCASCVSHVTKALRGVPGVLDASVNLATERAEVRHDGASAVALVAAVEEAGYEARTIDGDDDDEEDDRRRGSAVARKRGLLILAVALFVPTLAVGMFVPGFPAKNWILLALTLPVWAIVGWEFHRGTLAALRGGNVTMDTLVSLGSTAALAQSIYATFAHRYAYYESASAIITLVYAGKYLESVAKFRSTNALRALAALRPPTARRVRDDGSLETISVDLVRAGDIVSVAPGERIPVDGTVCNGTSEIDRAMLTGESLPQDVAPGDRVEQGTVNGSGALTVRADAVGKGTALAHILDIVRRAQGSTPPVQRLADTISAVFVPVILGLAALTLTGWMFSAHTFTDALVAAVSVLVVACPCALGLATPTAIVRAVGIGARRGLLFRDASSLERLANVRVVAFDKTGTLTGGAPDVLAVNGADGGIADGILELAAAVERSSSHPLARAIVAEAERRGAAIPLARDAVAANGLGMRAIVAGATISVGSARFLQQSGIIGIEPGDDCGVYVARNDRCLGSIELGDRPRTQAAQAVNDLRDLDVDVALVSGDAEKPTRMLADRLGIAQRFSRVLPADKAAIVASLRAEVGRVAFVGDGVNDAPALATADVGIAMGGGSAAALQTAGAAILNDDPTAVAAAIRLSRATHRTIGQNLFWALIYNVVLIPLAMFGVVHPMFAAAAMGLSSLFVVGNSLRLR